MADEIIEEVWRIKDELAEEFHYRLSDLITALRKREKESGSRVVNLSRRSQSKKLGGQTA